MNSYFFINSFYYRIFHQFLFYLCFHKTNKTILFQFFYKINIEMWSYFQYTPYNYYYTPLSYENSINLANYQQNSYHHFENNLKQIIYTPNYENSGLQINSSQLKVEETQSKNQEKMLGGIISQEDVKKLCISKIKKIWSDQQDMKLLDLVEKLGNNWQKISQYFTKKSPIQCLNRYKRISSPFLKRKWTFQEDQLIKYCVNQYGKDWPHFPQYFNDRTSKQIRQRYLNYLRPNLVSKNWTFDEDILLNQLVVDNGKKWKMFQKSFLGRSQNNIKNRYYGHIQRLLKLKERQLKKKYVSKDQKFQNQNEKKQQND